MGLFDGASSEQIADASAQIRERLTEELPRLVESIDAGGKLTEADRDALVKLATESIACKLPNR